MASLSYDGKIVNSAVAEIVNLSQKYELLSDKIKYSANKIVSANGFSEYIGGISSDYFKECVLECKTTIDELVKNIREMQITILSFLEDNSEIQAFLCTLDRLDYESLDLTPIEDYITFGTKAGNVAAGLFSSVGVFGISLVEGVGDFLETCADLLDIAATGILSVFTLGYDLITGENATERMWEETKARVSVKEVESVFNTFYSETRVGQALKKNAYGFETVRSIGKGVGYTAGIIALNVLTGGTAAGLEAAAGTVSGGQLMVTAGALGFSNGSEEAWADGATIEKGLAYGGATGLWEGAQWAIGGKISQVGGIGDKIATDIFKNTGSGALIRVGLDAIDSGAEGFVQPALTMIYKDYEGNTFAEKYSQAFNQAGGFKNVLTQASIGAVMSSAGEATDARKILKSNKNLKDLQDPIEKLGEDIPIPDIKIPPIDSVFESSVNKVFDFNAASSNKTATESAIKSTPEGSPVNKVFDSGIVSNNREALDFAKKLNPEVTIFKSWDDFKKATETDSANWRNKIENTYCEIDGNKVPLSKIVKGYINDFDTDPGSYRILNTVNRAKGTDATQTTKNLLLKNDDGTIAFDKNGYGTIKFKGVWGLQSTYKWDPVTDEVFRPVGIASGLNYDGSIGTMHDLLDRVDKETKLLSQALSDSKLDKPILLQRGSGMTALKKYGISKSDSAEEIYKKLTATGELFRDNGFMSTSPTSPFGGDVKYIITTKEGAEFGNFTWYNDGEQEVLLNYGSAFEVQGVKKAMNNDIYIYLKQQ